MDKLELKNLTPYLPYTLKRHCPSSNRLIHDYMPLDFIQSTIDMHSKFGWKPILWPITDLIGEIGLPAAVEDYLRGKGVKRIIDLPYWAIDWLCGANHEQHNYDVFGLIEKGLAIDVNTIEL